MLIMEDTEKPKLKSDSDSGHSSTFEPIICVYRIIMYEPSSKIRKRNQTQIQTNMRASNYNRTDTVL